MIDCVADRPPDAKTAKTHDRVAIMGDDPKMTLSTQKVLRALLDDPGGAHYGLDLCRRTGLMGGTLYPILARLERSGWVTGTWEDIDEASAGRRRRRYYTLTAEGASGGWRVIMETLNDLGLQGI